jgi:hypothetical protein
VMVRNCDGVATTAFCSIVRAVFCRKTSGSEDIVPSAQLGSRFKSRQKVIAVPGRQRQGPAT